MGWSVNFLNEKMAIRDVCALMSSTGRVLGTVSEDTFVQLVGRS